MRIIIAAVGRLKSGADRDLYVRYEKRCSAGRQIGLTDLSVIEIGEARADRGEDRMVQEAAGLLQKVRPTASDRLVLLDEHGPQMTSEAFAASIQSYLDQGTTRLIFLIGGPDGHGEAVRRASHQTLSLSKMTLPHGMARVLLAEQLYRAITIITDHPYHRA
ncbi:MAG: 23S rRNA (pseudouridine(1915)-N(3))-methyltransferase RlmH [Pseudomonadota bacterium]